MFTKLSPSNASQDNMRLLFPYLAPLALWLNILIAWSAWTEQPRPHLTGPSNSSMMTFAAVIFACIFAVGIQALLGWPFWYLVTRGLSRLWLSILAIVATIGLPSVMSQIFADPELCEDWLTALPLFALGLVPPAVFGYIYCIFWLTRSPSRSSYQA